MTPKSCVSSSFRRASPRRSGPAPAGPGGEERRLARDLDRADAGRPHAVQRQGRARRSPSRSPPSTTVPGASRAHQRRCMRFRTASAFNSSDGSTAARRRSPGTRSRRATTSFSSGAIDAAARRRGARPSRTRSTSRRQGRQRRSTRVRYTLADDKVAHWAAVLKRGVVRDAAEGLGAQGRRRSRRWTTDDTQNIVLVLDGDRRRARARPGTACGCRSCRTTRRAGSRRATSATCTRCTRISTSTGRTSRRR